MYKDGTVRTLVCLFHYFTLQDYIRAGAVSPVSPTTLLSGCYDRQVRMFDSRTKSDPVFTVDHGAPVESVLFLPSGGIFISAGKVFEYDKHILFNVKIKINVCKINY